MRSLNCNTSARDPLSLVAFRNSLPIDQQDELLRHLDACRVNNEHPMDRFTNAVITLIRNGGTGGLRGLFAV